jgi:oxygen-independent coproporphyrinogen-3 oxidase
LKRREYDKYLTDEIRSIAKYEYMRAPIDAVNFGGGTPTALLPAQLDRVLKELKNNFDIRGGAEISVESSVTEMTPEMADTLISNGVNRVSLGVQTFDDATRRILNRRGGGERAIDTIKMLIAKGVINTGIDLIYNYPNQTAAALQNDIDIIKSLNLAGVSFYSLMLHGGTPLNSAVTEAQRQIMSDTAREFELFSLIVDGLSGAGYEVFELTKLIRGGLDRYDYMRIKHDMGSCIAVGHGAGGNLDNYIYHNSAAAERVSGAINISGRGKAVTYEYGIIDRFINELQRTEVYLPRYSGLLHTDLQAALGGIIDGLIDDNLIEPRGSALRLTKAGLFWGNNIIDELVRAMIDKVKA